MTEGTNRYVALLRGINVGGGNVIRMADLRPAFEALGYRDVATYIQSGNVLFRARPTNPARMAAQIETALSAEFGYRASVVLRSRAQMRIVVERAPEGFGADALYRYDVLYLKEPLLAPEVLTSIRTRDGVDDAHAGDGVIYFSRLTRRASQSYLPRLVSMPVYQQITIRNWNTTTRLLQLLDA